MNQETGAVGGGQGGSGGGGGSGAPPGPPVLGPRKPSEQFTVDDFLYEMESRPQNRGSSLGPTTPMAAAESGVFSEENSDMYAQLEQKERDLVLAAELGKVLLDKNEELSRQNERIAEEFSLKLEVRKNPKLSRNIHSCLSNFLSKQRVHVTCDQAEVPNEMYVLLVSHCVSPTPLFTYVIDSSSRKKRCRQTLNVTMCNSAISTLDIQNYR